MLHAFNLSTHATEAGGSLSSKPALAIELVPELPWFHRKTLNTTPPPKKNRQPAMTQSVKVTVTKPDDFRLIRETHMEGGSQVLKVVL